MQVNNSILKRLESLEQAKDGPDNTIRLLVTEQTREDDPYYKESSDYIISQCKAACDSETFDNALGAAFIAVIGKNPLSKHGLVIFDITTEIAMQVVAVLTRQGTEVKL